VTRTRETGANAPLVLGLVTVVVSVVAAIVAVRSSLPPSPDTIVVLAQLVAGVAFVAGGMVLSWRDRSWTLGMLSMAVALALAAPHLRWVDSDVAWTVGWVLVDIHLVALAWLFLAFPGGRLDRTGSVFVAATAAYFLALKVAGHLFADAWPDCADCPSNLLLQRVDPALNQRIWDIGQLGNLVVLGSFVALLVTKRNRATEAGRRVLSPVNWALVPVAVTLVAVFMEPLIGFGSTGGRVVLIAERLALAAFPAALVAGTVRARFDRARVADLAAAVDRVTDAEVLQSLIADALGDHSAQLALRVSGGDELRTVEGAAVEPASQARPTVAITDLDGERLGVIVHDPAVDVELAGAVAATVAMAVRNERLRAELRNRLEEVTVSRRRLAEAAVTERRKVERDLHDGAQQGLYALAASLSSIRLVADEPVAGRIDGAITHLQAVITELRDLARGVYPPVLSERGLVPAIESLAERSEIPVSVSGRPRRHRPASEAAAYFLVAEALTNAARHADTDSVTVTLADNQDELVVSVADDGAGGATLKTGSGLEGLVDRFAAMGGTVTVTSEPGDGTTVEGRLPCG
jgi:signal transduction histidine kinase